MDTGIALSLIEIDPSNEFAREFLKGKGSSYAKGKTVRRSLSREYSSQHDDLSDKSITQEEWHSMEKSLQEGYTSLKHEAKLLKMEIEAMRKLGGIQPSDEDIVPILQAISEGRVSEAVPATQPPSVREVARTIMAAPSSCQEIITEDFEAVVRWMKIQNPPLESGEIRERLSKRKTLLEAALPVPMQRFSVSAFAQTELELLQRTYVNSETMLGDKVADIPRRNMLVTEDNYAWDMEELTQALAVNQGVMRNPLSKQIFSDKDIRIILSHPLGQQLKPLQLAQSQLKEGVRLSTIAQIDALGRIMLGDQSKDGGTSREAIDDFLGFMVTLPEAEQKTLNSLKIPGSDRNTGQPFDYTIGDSVRDAKANTTCFHKVGDYLSQAAVYLRAQ